MQVAPRELYSDICPHCGKNHITARLPECGLSQSEADFKNILKRLYSGNNINEMDLLRTVSASLLGGVESGYSKKLVDIDYNTPDLKMIENLTQNVYQFTGAKNYHELRDLTDAIHDGERVRSFNEFREEAEKIIGKYNKAWLETEYNQAVLTSQNAARWVEFEADKDIIPNLEYQTVGDGHVRESHRVLDGIVRPIEDRFWATHYPPNGWGCRCEAVQAVGRQTVTPEKNIPESPVPQMFRVNLAKEGLAFPEGHPYYKRLPKEHERLIMERSRQETRRILDNAEEYKRLIADRNYTDVEFNYPTGGLKATHIDHNFDPTISPFNKEITRGDYERKSRDILFSEGHKIILQSEKTKHGIRVPEGLLDDKKFDVKGIEGAGKRNIRDKLFDASKQGAETVVLYYPDDSLFSASQLKLQIESYYRNSTHKNIKTIYYIKDNQLFKYE